MYRDGLGRLPVLIRVPEPRQVPPCLTERAAFMSPHSFVRDHSHPYRRDDRGVHAHFRATLLNYPAYSAPGVPFRWMLKGSFSGRGDSHLREHYPLDDVNEELEPDLGFPTAWWQDYRNQSALLETFWAHVREEESLVLFYAKQVPLLEDIPGRRILVGVGRVNSIGPLTEYLYDGLTDGKLRSMLWERMIAIRFVPVLKTASSCHITRPWRSPEKVMPLIPRKSWPSHRRTGSQSSRTQPSM